MDADERGFKGNRSPVRTNDTTSWIHAVLHKIEGDPCNSRHWYQRANWMDNVADEPRAELAAIRAELRSRCGG